MIKSLTFTAMHFTIAFSVAYLLTGDWAVGGLIALVEPMVNSVGYYFHEKVWTKVEQSRHHRKSHPVSLGCPIHQ